MTSEDISTADDSEEATLEKYNIERTCVYSYKVGAYKYAKLTDAVAQAERERKT